MGFAWQTADTNSSLEVRSPPVTWEEIRSDVIESMRGSLSCSYSSRLIGFCRLNNTKLPSSQDALLADGCRGQPLEYLERNVDNQSRLYIAQELERLLSDSLFQKIGKRGMSIKDRVSLYYKIDQKLRFLEFNDESISLKSEYYGKWIPVCAFSRYVNYKIRNIINEISVTDVESDKEFAESLWVISQHSDFDPIWQEKMAHFYSNSKKLYMKKYAAYLIDRTLVARGKRQEYGTQLRCHKGRRVPFPVRQPEKLDVRRLSVGMVPMKQHLANYPRPCPKSKE